MGKFALAAIVAVAFLGGCSHEPASVQVDQERVQASVPGSNLKVRSVPYCRTLQRLLSGMHVNSTLDIPQAKMMLRMGSKICPPEV